MPKFGFESNMIDQIQIYLANFVIHKKCPLLIEKAEIYGEIINNTILWADNHGTQYFGKKATYQTKDKKVFVKLNKSYGMRYLFINFSLAKLFHSNNLFPVDQNQCIQIFHKVQEQLRDECKIEIDIYRAKISKIEIFRNIILNELYDHYTSIFQSLKFKGMEFDKFRSTYYWRKSQEELTAYNKSTEMKDKLNLIIPNVMRFEWKLTRNCKIKKELNITTVQDLVDKFASIPNIYRTTLQKHFFNKDIIFNDENKNSELNLNEVLHKYHEEHGRNYASNFFMDIGKGCLSINGFKKNLLEVIENISGKSKRSKLEKNIDRKDYLFNQLFNNDELYRYHIALYLELKTKVLTGDFTTFDPFQNERNIKSKLTQTTPKTLLKAP